MNYLTALSLLHDTLSPKNYVEIGCREGLSLSLSKCPAIGIDPDFEIRAELSSPTRLFSQTSDDFFARRNLRALLGGPVDLAFVDGMHRAEFVLRDIMNLERYSTPDSVIVIDDVLPEQIEWTTRERKTQAWTGDVYKVIPFLRKHRPDLDVRVFDIEMKGLAVITGFDPKNRTLQQDLARHEEHLAGDTLEAPDISTIRAQLAPEPADRVKKLAVSLLDKRNNIASDNPEKGSENLLYLDLLKRCLLNEIYLDDELRLLYLRDCLSGDDQLDYSVLHNIRESRADAYESLKASRRIGQFPDRQIDRSGFSHTMMGRLRLNSLHECLDDLIARDIPGDLMECGVWRGGGCILMAGWMRARGQTDRKLLIADSFDGLPSPSHEKDENLVLTKDRYPQLAVSERTVRENFSAYDLLDEGTQIFLKGWFRDTLKEAPTRKIALLRLDGDLYESTMDALDALYDRVSPGGVVIIDDYGALDACRMAGGDFFAAREEPVPSLTKIDWTGSFFVKPG